MSKVQWVHLFVLSSLGLAAPGLIAMVFPRIALEFVGLVTVTFFTLIAIQELTVQSGMWIAAWRIRRNHRHGQRRAVELRAEAADREEDAVSI